MYKLFKEKTTNKSKSESDNYKKRKSIYGEEGKKEQQNFLKYMKGDKTPELPKKASFVPTLPSIDEEENTQLDCDINHSF